MDSRGLRLAMVAILVLGVGLAVQLRLSFQPAPRTVGPSHLMASGMDSYELPLPVSNIYVESSSSPALPTAPAPTATVTHFSLLVGNSGGKDLEDVALLFDSQHVSDFDINFCKLAQYYGLLCKIIPLDSVELSDALLRDGEGNHFKLIGMGGETILRKPSLLDADEIRVLTSAVKSGSHLLISKLRPSLDKATVEQLTDGVIVGIEPVREPRQSWNISSVEPAITRQFTGQVLEAPSSSHSDFAVTSGGTTPVTNLIESTDDAGAHHPILVHWKSGAGSIFADAGQGGHSLDEFPFRDLYYSPSSFSDLAPILFALRYSLGNEVWHTNHYYANLTIDDPPLKEPAFRMSYSGLLSEMQVHNFHTTIAFVPAHLRDSQKEVINLFLANPDRFSLVQHGNNHDGYEFYKYTVSENDTFQGQKMRARPLAEQDWDIKEGLARMGIHQQATGILFDRIMIFPYGISPAPTLALLKKYNYLATVNSNEIPLETQRPSDWDFGMYQASLDFEDFPSLLRRPAGKYQPFRPNLVPFLFDLFLGKPALFYSHPYAQDLFGDGIDAFDPVADQLNGLPGGVEWRSLGYILKHLYLEKTNDDGSVDIKFYSNDVVVSPLQNGGATYHFEKEELMNVPIQELTVNGNEFPYRVEQGKLRLDVAAAQDGSPIEVVIHYGD